MEHDKKIVAAITAVMDYLKTEEEIIHQQTLSAQAVAQAPVTAKVPVNMWGLSGRQAIMQMRNLMQMKIFR
ncbi:MAG: hypothetical protein JSU83_14440 [Deltaproteobacteria bacterium]|nr:MAG: hypothetical protein JSU83_14440 [Deltaproteobacteria bacterium]